MQISKLSSAICAVAVGASLISVRAQDNPAQAAARAALLEKMNEAEKAPAQPPAVVVTPAGASVQKPAPPSVVQTPPAQPAPPMTPAPSGDNPAQAAARAALMEKMNGPGGANAQPPLTIVTTPSNATSTSPKPMTTTPAKMDAASKAAQSDAAAQAAARAKAQDAANAPKATKKDVLGLPPIPAPALPISAAKQEQLQALLARYKADQITPEEYQTQRAAILAQP